MQTHREQRGMTTGGWIGGSEDASIAQNGTHLDTAQYSELLNFFSNSTTSHNFSVTSSPQTTSKQLTSQQLIAQSKPAPYDSKGAAYYICSVILVYALAIVLLVVSLTKRKRKDQYQPANQRSNTKDYYVNIQKDWSLESSGTSRNPVEGLKRSSTSGSFGLTYIGSSKSPDLNNNSHKMVISSTKSTRKVPTVFKMTPAIKANSLDSILKEHKLYNTCQTHRIKMPDTMEESITLVQVLPGRHSSSSPVTPANEHHTSPSSPKSKLSKRSSSKCRWSISADGNILILQISDDVNETKMLNDSYHAPKRINKVDQEIGNVEAIKSLNRLNRSANSSDLANNPTSCKNIKSTNTVNSKSVSLHNHVGQNGYLKSSKHQLKPLYSKQHVKEHESQNWQPLWQCQEKDNLKNGYQKINISNLCEIYDASPTKLHLTKQKKSENKPSSKPLLNIENFHIQAKLPEFTKTIGRHQTKKLDFQEYEDPMVKLTKSDFTPTRASFQKFIHVTSV